MNNSNNLVNYLISLESEESFYGRIEERKKLKDFLDKKQLIVVRGEPAIGKSTLVTKVLSDYATKSNIIDVTIERGDVLYPHRVFAEIIKEIFGNPKNDEEVNKSFNFYDGNKVEKEIIKSFLWSYYPFEDYKKISFSSEEIEKLVSGSLVNFFSSYEEPLIVRIQNYERRLLGENKKTDELIKEIGTETSIPFIIETRDDLNLGEEIILGPLEEFPLKEYFQAHRILLDDNEVSKIRKLSKNHPYIMELWPFFFQNFYKIIDDKFKSLENFLDIAVQEVNANEKQRHLLNMFSLAQKPLTPEKIIEITKRLNLNEEDVKTSSLELVKKRLVYITLYKGVKSFSVKNPRLGERILELMDDKEKTELHKSLYEVSEDNKDRFWHSISGKMPVEAFETTINIAKYSNPRDTIEVCNKSIELMESLEDKLDKIIGDESLRSRMIKLVFRKASKELSLGNYEPTEFINKIRLNKPYLPENPDFDWFECSLNFVLNRGFGDFNRAQKCLDEMKIVAERIDSKKTFLSEDPRVLVEYNQIYFFYERACLDESLDDNKRKQMLEEGVRRMYNLDRIPDDDNILACSLRELSKYSENKEKLLEEAEKYVLNALKNTEKSHKQSYMYVTAAGIYLAKGEDEKAKNMLGESDNVAENYGRNRKDTIEALLVKIEIAERAGIDSLVKKYVIMGDNLLDHTKPKNISNYRGLFEKHKKKLSEQTS